MSKGRAYKLFAYTCEGANVSRTHPHAVRIHLKQAFAHRRCMRTACRPVPKIFSHNRCLRTPNSMIRYPGECKDLHPRLWPTAGVWEQRLCASLRLLPTAGVCDQRLGASHRLLLTAGVCEQHLSGYLRLLLNSGVCSQQADT